jgi:hypothetical protein
MFFKKGRELFERRPKPKYRLGQYVTLRTPKDAAKPIQRHVIVRKRRWMKSEGKWFYSGPVIVPVSSDGTTVIRMYAEDVPEDQLGFVRGGDLGLPT